MATWLRLILVNNLMEDAATVEVSRAQIWQWIHHPQGILQDGRKVTIELFHQLMNEELEKLRNAIGEEQFAKRRFMTAAQILDESHYRRSLYRVLDTTCLSLSQLTLMYCIRLLLTQL